MAQLWTSLGAWVPGHCRVIQLVAASRGEGTSTIAREFARLATERVQRSVWLVDVDVPAAGQYDSILEEPARFGGLGPEKPATPDGSVFFTVQPPVRGPDGRPWPDGRYLAVHQVGGKRLWVTRFRRELLRPGQQPHVTPSDRYWTALRRHADVVILDTPSADRSRAGVILAPFVDTTVLVVAADDGDVRQIAALRDDIAEAGGRCAGIVFNRAQVETPGFLRAILP